VKNRFQSLPFNCNLQRYISAAAAGCGLQLHPADRGFYCYVVDAEACEAAISSAQFPGASWRPCNPLYEALTAPSSQTPSSSSSDSDGAPAAAFFETPLQAVASLPELATLNQALSSPALADVRASLGGGRVTLLAPTNAAFKRLAERVRAAGGGAVQEVCVLLLLQMFSDTRYIMETDELVLLL
jgi:hypothetical protein